MKKKKQLLLTCIISILILISVFCFLSGYSTEKTYSVFLLNQDILSGSKIEQEMVYSVTIPEKSSLPEACKTLEAIVGKYCNRDMKNGTILSFQDLTASQSGIAYPSITNGKVLYTLALESDDANGWWIAKGNTVLLYIYDVNEQPYEDTTLQDAEIMKTTTTIIESVKIIRLMDEAGNEVTEEGIKPKIVCLEVSREQAQVLFDAENSKKIKLIPENSTK